MPINLTPRQRCTLLDHVAGERAVRAVDLDRLRVLAARDLIALVPAHTLRPRRARITDRGRSIAEAIRRADLTKRERRAMLKPQRIINRGQTLLEIVSEPGVKLTLSPGEQIECVIRRVRTLGRGRTVYEVADLGRAAEGGH